MNSTHPPTDGAAREKSGIDVSEAAAMDQTVSDALIDIVARMPRTADNFPISIGDCLWLEPTPHSEWELVRVTAIIESRDGGIKLGVLRDDGIRELAPIELKHIRSVLPSPGARDLMKYLGEQFVQRLWSGQADEIIAREANIFLTEKKNAER